MEIVVSSLGWPLSILASVLLSLFSQTALEGEGVHGPPVLPKIEGSTAPGEGKIRDPCGYFQQRKILKISSKNQKMTFMC